MNKIVMNHTPEGSDKFTKLKKMKTSTKKSEDFSDEEDENEERNDSEDKQRLIKTMINFGEEGIVISAYDLHSIEKDIRFVEKPTAHWEFGITINKGLNQDTFIRKTDISMWYIREDIRDEKWDRIMKLLKKEGLNVIEI